MSGNTINYTSGCEKFRRNEKYSTGRKGSLTIMKEIRPNNQGKVFYKMETHPTGFWKFFLKKTLCSLKNKLTLRNGNS